jgi:SulP family sulfate permease
MAAHLSDANLFPLSIGLGVLAIIGISERLSARVPGALIGLAQCPGASAARDCGSERDSGN